MPTTLSLEPAFALALVIAILGGVGSFFGVKYGQAETQRLVKALHSRFDSLAEQQRKTEVDVARLDERVEGIRDTQRLRMRARAEAARAGQPPVFDDDAGGEG